MVDLKQYAPVVIEEEPGGSPPTSPNLPPQTNSPFGTFNPRFNEKRLRDVYWISPTKMVTLLVFGIFMSLAHHLYYQSRVGKVVGNESDQQNEHRIGNFFAFVVQSSLATSMGFAYIQWLWMTLKEEEVSVGTLNSAFSAPHSILFIFNGEMRRKIKVGTLIALTAWCMPIPSLFTPATLFVNPTIRSTPKTAPVQVLGIANATYANFYEYSVPSNGPNSTGSQLLSQMFLGPRTIVDRLCAATASEAQILPIAPPYVNSTYEIQFYGPMVQCSEANASQVAIMVNLTAQQFVTQDNITAQQIAYYAYVPDLSVPDQAGIYVDRLQQPSNGSNQLWLSFKRNGTGFTIDPVPTCPITEYRICKLYNASYDLTMTFVEGNQTVKGFPPTILNEVVYPVLDPTVPSDLVQLSYSAYMWAFTNQLVGQMGFYNDTSTNRTTPAMYSEIKTTLEATGLLGSSDLDCFFGANSILPDTPGETNYSTPLSPQRQLDVNLARNETLDVLIPELAFNTTVSLMNDPFLAPPQNRAVNTTESINLWAYHKADLWAAYGLAIIIAIIVNLLGAYAYIINGVAHDISFSSLVSATTDSTITCLFKTEDPAHRGKLPLPDEIAVVPITFTPLDEGGLGFQTAIEVRRRSSVAISSAISSPNIRAMEQSVMVIEEVATHNHILCHSVWFKSPSNPTRPKASIQIYDTSSSTYYESNARQVVDKLAQIFGRSPNNPNPAPYPDRLDIYSLPISGDVAENERVRMCIEHQHAEIEYRKARQKLEGGPWYFQSWDTRPENKWKRFLVVVDIEMERWADSGILFVWYDPIDKGVAKEKGKDMDVKRWKGRLDILSRKMAEVRAGFNWEVGKRQFDRV